MGVPFYLSITYRVHDKIIESILTTRRTTRPQNSRTTLTMQIFKYASMIYRVAQKATNSITFIESFGDEGEESDRSIAFANRSRHSNYSTHESYVVMKTIVHPR